MAGKNEYVGPQLPPHMRKQAEESTFDDTSKTDKVLCIFVLFLLFVLFQAKVGASK